MLRRRDGQPYDEPQWSVRCLQSSCGQVDGGGFWSRSRLRAIDGDICSATGRSRHSFLRHFFVGTSNGVAGVVLPGTITVQFIPSLLLEAASSIEQRENICPSTRRRLEMAGSIESAWGSTAIARRPTGLRRVRANFGIDIRTPAFDRRVVEFCIGIPQDQYLRKGRDRWLIRRAMQGRLPDSCWPTGKRGHSRLTGSRD